MNKIYLTQINVIRGLTKREYFQLRELCFFGNCLYNSALYNIRQKFFADKTFLNFAKNYRECKENENYKLLQSNMAQQILRDVDEAFKSFFASLGKVKNIRPPKYRKRGGLYQITISGNSISIRDGFLTIPVSRTYKNILNDHKIKIKIPERLISRKIKEVKIIPSSGGKYFKISYCFEVNEESLRLNLEKLLAIDFGSNNLATCVTNSGTSFIMDGRKIKHINQHWNKRKAFLQSILMKQKRKQYFSNLIWRITLKRNNRINDCLKKTARYIINFCINNDIGTLICGYNPNFKREINLGKKTNQNFVQIPFGALRRQLKTLCERYGMKYIEQEESYTSKASFLDLDEIPIFDREKPYEWIFSGERIKRGLYRSKTGKILNADVNGAANILRKSKQNFNYEELCAGLLDSPLRIRVD